MKADLRTNGNGRESVSGFDVYLVVHAGAEWGDEVRVGGVEGLAAGNVGEEIFPDKLVLGTPDLPSVFVEDGIEVWVSGRRVSARRSSEKVREKIEVEGDFVKGGSRLYGGGGGDWGWAPNDVFGRWVTEGGSGRAGWEDGGDRRQDVLDFLDEWEVGDERVEIGSVGGDVGEEVQRFVLKVVELVASDGEEGVEKEACRRGRDVVVEERRSRGENVLAREERVLNGGSGGFDVGLVDKPDFGPTGRGGDRGGGGAVGRV